MVWKSRFDIQTNPPERLTSQTRITQSHLRNDALIRDHQPMTLKQTKEKEIKKGWFTSPGMTDRPL